MSPCDSFVFLDDAGEAANVVPADDLTDGDNLGMGISVRRLFFLLEEGVGVF